MTSKPSNVKSQDLESIENANNIKSANQLINQSGYNSVYFEGHVKSFTPREKVKIKGIITNDYLCDYNYNNDMFDKCCRLIVVNIL